MRRFALAISAADICEKSFSRRTSRSETVRRAEKRSSSRGGSGFCFGALSASCTREAPGSGLASGFFAPGDIGDICAISFSISARRRQNRRKA